MKIVILILMVILSINLFPQELETFSDGFFNYTYDNNFWVKENKAMAVEVLKNEGMNFEGILYCSHKNNGSYLIIGKAIFSQYFPPEHFLENTRDMAIDYFSLNSRWPFQASLVGIPGVQAKGVISGVRSGNETTNNFPTNTTGIWFEILTPLFNKKSNKSELVFYVIYLRIPNNNWHLIKDSYHKDYFQGRINFNLDHQYIELSDEMYFSMSLLEEQGFTISLPGTISEPETEPAAPASIAAVEEKPVHGVSPAEIRNYFRSALEEAFSADASLEFMPDRRLALKAITEKNAKQKQFEDAELYFDNEAMHIFDRKERKIIRSFSMEDISGFKTKGVSYVQFYYQEKRIQIRLDLAKNVNAYFGKNLSR